MHNNAFNFTFYCTSFIFDLFSFFFWHAAEKYRRTADWKLDLIIIIIEKYVFFCEFFRKSTVFMPVERRWGETCLSLFAIFAVFKEIFPFFSTQCINNKKNIHAIFSFVHKKLRWMCVVVRKLMLKKLKLGARAHDVYFVGGHRTSSSSYTT